MMTGSAFAVQALLAAALIGAALYLPGRLFLRALRLKPEPLEGLAAALVAGVCLLTGVYLVLLRLGWGGGLWVAVAAAAATELALAGRERVLRLSVVVDGERLPEPLRAWWPLGLMMLAGMAAQGWFMVRTGWLGPDGMMLWAWHGHDAPWHVFNLYQMSRGYPEAPGFSGDVLRNYHMFSDLLWGALLRLAPLDPWHVYLRLAPFFYSGLLTLTVFTAALAWSRQKRTAYLAAALAVFITNFGYWLPLLFGPEKYFFWDSVFWVQSPLGTIFNPGVSSSYALVMLGLWALIRWQADREWGHLALLALVWGLLPGFKVYPALLVVAALGVTGLARLVLNRDAGMLWAFAAVLPVALLVFLPVNHGAPSLVRLLPGYNLAAMLVAPDRLVLMTPSALKLLYASSPWLVALLIGALIPVFVVGNLGVRSLGLLPMLRAAWRPREAEPILLWLAVLGGGALAAPVLFVQTGVQWNTIQFYYYAVLTASLPAAAEFWRLADRRPGARRWLWLALFLALGLPNTVQSWLRMDWGFHLDRPRCDALLWLKTEAGPRDRVLRPLPESLQTEEGYAQWLHYQERGKMTSFKDWKQEADAFSRAAAAGATTTAAAAAPAGNTVPAAAAKPPEKIVPLGWQDSTFVAGLTERNTFLEDTVSAQILGYPVADRVDAVRRFYATAGAVEARDLLEKNRIRYVIQDTGKPLPFDPAGVPLKVVFANAALTIYKYLGPGW